MTLSVTPVFGQGIPREEAFHAFWQGFRAAVLAGDLNAVARMSRLPVESRGELDDEPLLRLTAATFPPAFRRLLATMDDPGSGRTVLDWIRDTTRPRLDGCNAFARPGQPWKPAVRAGMQRLAADHDLPRA